MDFKHRVRPLEHNNTTVMLLDSFVSPEDRDRLIEIREYWDFYEGYHWEGIEDFDKPQITKNYCRPFVDKFVAFEFGLGFIVKSLCDINQEEQPITNFLNNVWDDNNKNKFAIELGQVKSITGDGWISVKYEDPKDLIDPFKDYEKGRIRLTVLPTEIVFPEYDQHDKDKILKLTLAYPIERESNVSGIFRKTKFKQILYRQVWTIDTIEEYHGHELISSIPNPYGIIPFVHIPNTPVVGRTKGISDLADLVSLNTELNLKTSDVSEILDYHASPVTVVYGAKISSLEKGANKMWGGLPKDARIQNLSLDSDLQASVTYIDGLKTAMHEVGRVPEGALGGSQAISNTSGVALHFVNLPLIEKTRTKRLSSIEGLIKVNKLILLLGLHHNMITRPEGAKDFFKTDVDFPDTLPKDELILLQQLQMEMQLGLESRRGAMKKLGKEDIETTLTQADEDRKQMQEEQMQLQMQQMAMQQAMFQQNKQEGGELNSGMTNGSTPKEEKRKEINGENKKK